MCSETLLLYLIVLGSRFVYVNRQSEGVQSTIVDCNQYLHTYVMYVVRNQRSTVRITPGRNQAAGRGPV